MGPGSWITTSFQFTQWAQEHRGLKLIKLPSEMEKGLAGYLCVSVRPAVFTGCLLHLHNYLCTGHHYVGLFSGEIMEARRGHFTQKFESGLANSKLDSLPNTFCWQCAAKPLPPMLSQNFIHSPTHSFIPGQQVFTEHLVGVRHRAENTIQDKTRFLSHRTHQPAQGLTQMNEKLLRGTCMALSPH